MVNTGYLFLMIFVGSMTFPIYDASAHSLFNSSEEKIGNYRVQIATLPEIPTIGEKSQILFRVLDNDEREVERFRMGVRVYFSDELVDTIPPQYHEKGHWETDYVFNRPGNHIFRVDLYDVRENGDLITYTFNVSTLNPFGYIFYYVIIAGGFGGFGIIIWSVLSRKKRARL